MTTVIAFVSQKGGVGKSTISRALAREAANGGLSTKIADLDIQQGSSSSWQRRRLAKNTKPDISVECYATAQQALSSMAVDLDLLIIDAPARASQGTLEIAKVADLIVQPTSSSVDDLEPGVMLFHSLVKNGIDRKKLVFALNRLSAETDEQEARDYIEEAGYQVLTGAVHTKKSYKTAQDLGLSITETRFQSLNESADLLLQALIDKIGEE